MKRLDTYKRILLALSERKVPRVHALILAELNDGSSPRTILGAIQKAVKGKRKATGNKDEDEFDMALLTKHISPRLQYALNKSDGLASETSTNNHFSSMPRFVSCASTRLWSSSAIVVGFGRGFIFFPPRQFFLRPKSGR